MQKHVPHSELESGEIYYIRTTAKPGWCVAKVQTMVLGEREGELGVWLIGEDRAYYVSDLEADQFIAKVESPL